MANPTTRALSDPTAKLTPMSNTTALVTPCHGLPLLITTRTEGSAYLTYEVADEIHCQADGCYNTWQADGTASPYNT